MSPEIRSKWTGSLLALAALGLMAARTSAAGADAVRPPNVVLIMTDDQGHGDFSSNGNPIIRTPVLDQLARDSASLTDFHVCPVCSPTRASLLTGRYNYRTGVVDTFLGRSMMRPEEVTLAEILGAAGYRTGIFGKWHLGDNYPLRPIDQGFQEALVHGGGGLAQPSDPPPGSSYFDPLLRHNGRPIQAKGYCTDVFTDAAMRFIAEQRDRPFFVYLAYNCPHTPLQLPDSYLDPYRKQNLTADMFPRVGQPIGKLDADATARIYGMVTNIDDNLGRLFGKLDELKLASDTIVIFLTDNGPQQPRYNSGLRNRKGSVYEGGIRVPCFIRWPGTIAPRRIDALAAHIDIVPTLLDLCKVHKPDGVAFDGLSLRPVLQGERNPGPERTLFVQWHRGDVPERYRACAVRTPRYKLVQGQGAGGGPLPDPLPFELFDLENDRFEESDLAARHPEIVATLRKAYDSWFEDVGRRGYEPPRIILGSARDNPSLLTRQDWRGPKAAWSPTGLGYWEVAVEKAGKFDVTVRLRAAAKPATVRVALGGVEKRGTVEAGGDHFTFGEVELPAGPGRLEAEIVEDGMARGATYVEVRRRDG